MNQLMTGATVVTATRRLARELQIRHANAMVVSGRSAWKSADVLPWSAWLTQLWDQNMLQSRDSLPSLLTDPQARTWWETTLQERSDLLQTSAAARTAYKAWQLLMDFQVPVARLRTQETRDTAHFVQWATAYTQTCQERNWLDPASLTLVLSSHLQELKLGNQQFVFAGFDEFLPAQQKFLRALAKSGAQIETWLPKRSVKSAVRLGQADSHAELLSAARFCRKHLNRSQRIDLGVVVPNLNQIRADVKQVFDSVLDPLSCFNSDGEQASPFHISMGKPLVNFGVIQAALWTLEFVHRDLSYGEVISWLNSTFVGDQELTRQARADLETAVRRSGRYRWRFGTFVQLVREQHIRGFSGIEGLNPVDENQERSGAHWARYCSDVLTRVGWPGDHGLGSTDHQLRRSWLNLLDQTASRDLIVGPMTFREFFVGLSRRGADMIFEPRSTGAPIQIVGILESAGLYFDHLWVTGLIDERWPWKQSANPFIPPMIRKEFGIPGGSAHRDLEFAHNLSDRLLGSATNLVISYPEKFQDQPLRPSPLIRSIPETSEADLDLSERSIFVEELVDTGMQETITDVGPAIVDKEVGGGSGVLKAQSACPFRAFAQYRLHAQPMDVPQPSFDARQRGIFVHEVMQRLWESLRSQSTLLAMQPQELKDQIYRVCRATLRPFLTDEDGSVKRLAELELARIQILVENQLELEKQRPPFQVEATEHQHRVQLDKLRLRIRIDRVDRRDGGHYLVDYKTGNADANQWLGERPDEPQLLLYARAYGQSVAGLVYARLKTGETGFNGVTRNGGEFPGVAGLEEHTKIKASSWSDLLREWERVTVTLAQDYARGLSQVDPLQNACDYCHLASLCRIADQGNETSL